MKKKKPDNEALTIIFLILALAGTIFFSNGCARASGNKDSVKADVSVNQEAPDNGVKPEGSDDNAVPATAALTDIKVTYKLDPRLTRSLYMGDRWVSPPTYTSTVQAGKEITVEARARGIDARGKTMNINPKWIPADPEMVAVSPQQGRQVKITVRRAGKSSLEVASQGFSKKLSIKATYKSNLIQVEISQ